MAVNFKELLSTPVTDAERPKPRPAGKYFGTISAFKFDESREQKTPFVRISLKGIQPGPGITADPATFDRLQKSGGTEKWNLNRDYYLTEDAKYRLRELMESCKLKVEGRSFLEVIPELVNQPVAFDVSEESYERKDGETGISNKITEMRGA